MKTTLAAASSFLLLANCATVTRGTNDVLQINTSPIGAQVQTSNGYSCGSTPCAIRMPRRSEFVATISKPGCETARVNVTHRTAGGRAAGVAGNVLVGGPIGLGVDVATGASQELVPNPVDVTLNWRPPETSPGLGCCDSLDVAAAVEGDDGGAAGVLVDRGAPGRDLGPGRSA